MGKGISKEAKQDNIIVAQSGTNSIQMEQKLETFGLITLVMVVLLAVIIAYCVYKKLYTGIKAWTRRQIVFVTKSTQPVQVEPTPGSPQVIYA